MILDVHTHNPLEPHAIASGSPEEVTGWLGEHPRGLYSVGIHPWATATLTPHTLSAQLDALESVAAHPQVVAIGETGMDSLRGASLDVQRTVFLHHIELSERIGKPLVLHVVRQHDAVLQILRRLKPTQPWIWHAFRGTPARAAEVIGASYAQFLSFGRKFNPLTPPSVPSGRILLESDAPADALPDMHQLLSALADSLGMTSAMLAERLTDTTKRIFGKMADN